jgi:hypothetical protein
VMKTLHLFESSMIWKVKTVLILLLSRIRNSTNETPLFVLFRPEISNSTLALAKVYGTRLCVRTFFFTSFLSFPSFMIFM